MPAHDPIQLLHVGGTPPDLSTSGYGPFVVHGVADLAEAAEALADQRFDALVLELADAAATTALLQWLPLARLVPDVAVLVVTPEPVVSVALQLVRAGVQDLVPRRSADAETIARCVRLGVERKRLERAARNVYATDLGTGLPNRAQLMEHMTHLLALREREPASMALLVFRVDGLPAVEARMGTEAAQVLRRKAAVRLRSGLRASDVVAALGGDSFAVLLAWIVDAADGERVAAKLVRALQSPFSVTGQDLVLAVQAGVAQYPVHAKDADGLLRRAQGQAEQQAGGTQAAPHWQPPSTRSAANDE